MDYFIDFDHTLYNTKQLIESMLNAFAEYLLLHSNLSFGDIKLALNSKFKRGESGIYDIYALIDYFSKSPDYDFDIKEANQVINNIVLNGKEFLFNDSISFLQYLKSNGNKIHILSYNEDSLYFQTVKIIGSGILPFVDSIIPTSTIKGNMPLEFSKCIFIDDKPDDLISIYEKKPFKIYRINRKNDTYSNEPLDLPIPEYDSLNNLKDNLNFDN